MTQLQTSPSLAPIAYSKRVMVADVQKAVCQAYGISREDLLGPSRAKVHVIPRQVAIYLCRRLCKISQSDIARRFNRDNTTAIHAIRTVEGYILSGSRGVDAKVNLLTKLLRESL